ncbi:MAG: hypothetical protein Pg6A_11380 [Termitinemataceae bacterium]|nr:MAG: hypothetical protein Pg6A_11380 [Termitinemataceae bacterium]
MPTAKTGRKASGTQTKKPAKKTAKAAAPPKKSKKEAAFWAQNNKRSFLLHIRMLIDVIIPVRGLKSFKRFIDDDIGYTVVKV